MPLRDGQASHEPYWKRGLSILGLLMKERMDELVTGQEAE